MDSSIAACFCSAFAVTIAEVLTDFTVKATSVALTEFKLALLAFFCSLPSGASATSFSSWITCIFVFSTFFCAKVWEFVTANPVCAVCMFFSSASNRAVLSGETALIVVDDAFAKSNTSFFNPLSLSSFFFPDSLSCLLILAALSGSSLSCSFKAACSSSYDWSALSCSFSTLVLCDANEPKLHINTGVSRVSMSSEFERVPMTSSNVCCSELTEILQTPSSYCCSPTTHATDIPFISHLNL